MIRSAVLVAVAALSLSAMSNPAQAGGGYGYPWCAQYTYGLNECNFYTWQQCQVAVTGVGGVCARNPFFRGELPPERKYRRWYWW
jgi:hypothetical protein